MRPLRGAGRNPPQPLPGVPGGAEGLRWSATPEIVRARGDKPPAPAEGVAPGLRWPATPLGCRGVAGGCGIAQPPCA